MRTVTILLAVVAVLALAGPAWANTYWAGPAGTPGNPGTPAAWEVGTNWTDGVPDPGEDYVRITNYGTAQISSSTSDISVTQLLPGGYWNEGFGHVLMTGGNINWCRMRIGYANSGSEASTFTQEGGRVSCIIMVGPPKDDSANNGLGKYTISGGSIDRHGTGLYRDLHVGVRENKTSGNGTGTFVIDGAAATGGPSLIKILDYTQNQKSTLEIILDSNGDITPITATGNVILDGTLKITGTRTATTPLVLMTYSGTLNGTFATEPGGNWTIDYGITTPGQVTATIPEPATMVLLGLGGLGVLIRRKRR